MSSIPTSHRVILIAVFAVAMLGVTAATKWGVNEFGWWIAIPILAAGLLIAWLWDRKDARDQRDKAG